MEIVWPSSASGWGKASTVLPRPLYGWGDQGEGTPLVSGDNDAPSDTMEEETQ